MHKLPKPGESFFQSLVRQGCVFDPGTMMLVSTGISAVGAIAGGMTQAAAYDSAASANRANEQILKENAAQASREASTKEDILRERQRIARGRQIASVGQAGIGFEGSGGDVIEQADIFAEMDNLSVRYEGETRRRNFNNEAKFQAFEAGVNKANARSSRQSGFLKAIGAAASGGASYGQYQQLYGSSSLSPAYSTGPGIGGLY